MIGKIEQIERLMEAEGRKASRKPPEESVSQIIRAPEGIETCRFWSVSGPPSSRATSLSEFGAECEVV
jgi:hypothetical protein